MEVRIYLLGGFRLERAGLPVPKDSWQRRDSARTLVKWLAVEPSHRLHRELVMETLWHANTERALNAFGKALHAARRALEPDLPPRQGSNFLFLQNGLVTLNAAALWIDVDEFETLARRALRLREPTLLQEADAIYAGELLPEDRYEDWSALRRESLGSLHERVLDALALHAFQAGAIADAEELWRRVLTRNHAHEAVHRALMRLYAATGARTAALKQFEACRVALRHEFGAAPEPETVALHAEILAGKHVSEVDSVTSSVSVETLSLPAAIRLRPRLPIVGRSQFLEIMGNDLTDVAGGHGRVNLLLGEHGIGKTRLMREVAYEANRRGMLVLWGTASAHEPQTPYAVYTEAIEGFSVSSSDEFRAELSSRYPLLSMLVPSLEVGAELPVEELDPELLRGRIAAELAAVLGFLADRAPVMLALDDGHAISASGLHLLERLVRTAGDHRWLILASFRDDAIEGGSTLADCLNILEHDFLGRRIPIDRLSEGDSGTLAKTLLAPGIVPASILDQVYAMSSGNPLYIEELLRGLRDSNSLRRVAGRWQMDPFAGDAIPASVVDLVALRLDRFDATMRNALNLAAILGMDFAAGTLQEAAEIAFPATLAGDRLLDTLDRALSAGVLEDRGSAYCFAQPLMRAAILKRLPNHRRAPLHAAVATAIEHRYPTDIERLAFHYGHADQHYKAIHYLDLAAERASALISYPHAIAYYKELVVHYGYLRDEHGAAVAAQKAGVLLARLARYDEALAELESALTTFRFTGDRENLAYTVAQLAEVYFLRGAPAEGIERLLAVRRRLSAANSPIAHAIVATGLASLHWVSGRYEVQLEEANRALELLQQAESTPLTTQIKMSAQSWRAFALLALNRPDEAIGQLESVIPQVEVTNDLITLAGAALTLADAYRNQGDQSRQSGYLEQALDAVRRLGDPVRLAFMLYRQAEYLRLRGDWAGAQSYLDQALRLEAQSGLSWTSPYLQQGQGILILIQGDATRARQHLEEALDLARATGGSAIALIVHMNLARLDLRESHPGAVVQRVAPLLRDTTMRAVDAAVLQALLAEALLMLDDLDGAWEAAEASSDRARAAGERPILAGVLRAHGTVALGIGKFEDAHRSSKEMIDLAHDLHIPHLEAHGWNVRARTYMAEGLLYLAREAFIRALQLYTDLGARADMEQTRAMLDRLDRPAR